MGTVGMVAVWMVAEAMIPMVSACSLNSDMFYWLTKEPMLPTSKCCLHRRNKIKEHEHFLLHEKTY